MIPPKIRIEPKIWNGSICSRNISTEKKTADNGSRYPNTAMVCAGKELERICFPAMSYNTYTSLLDGKVDIDVFLTMNVSMDFYGQNYEKKMQEYFAPFHFLKGQTWIFPVCDTLQVKDYSKYELKSFDEEHKYPPPHIVKPFLA